MSKAAARLEQVFRLIELERNRQDARWGVQNHDEPYWLGIVVEEIGELAQAIIDPSSSERQIEDEAIQAAACLVAFVQFLRRREE